MLNTSDVKSLSKGGTTVSLEEISNSIDNKLSIDNLTGSNGIEIAKNAAGDKVNIKGAIPITVQFTQLTETIGQYTVTLRPNIDIPSGPYADWKFVCDNTNSYYDFIGFHLNGASEATSKLLYAEGPFGNVKTLFGNQSIYGSGNIDLYKHNVIISQGSTESERMCVYCQILSSNNLNINSLANFQTIVKDDNEFIPATGKLKLYNGDTGSVIGGVCKAGAIEYNIRGKYTTKIDFSSGWATINAVVSGGLTFHDTVTTV